MPLLLLHRLLPSFLISFIDLAVAYQLMLIFYGLVRGLVSLDVGVIGDFSALIREFHRAPLLWWAKVRFWLHVQWGAHLGAGSAGSVCVHALPPVVMTTACSPPPSPALHPHDCLLPHEHR
jgi:hypothetical protein